MTGVTCERTETNPNHLFVSANLALIASAKSVRLGLQGDVAHSLRSEPASCSSTCTRSIKVFLLACLRTANCTLYAYRQQFMRTLIVDHDSSVPVYQQIADALRGLVARGQLSAGEALPSVRQLGRQLGVNLNTVAKAYRLLAQEGLVELKQGAPAKVTGHTKTDTEEPAKPVGLDPAALRALHRVIDKWVLNGANRKQVEKLLAKATERYFRAAKAAGEHR